MEKKYALQSESGPVTKSTRAMRTRKRGFLYLELLDWLSMQAFGMVIIKNSLGLVPDSKRAIEDAVGFTENVKEGLKIVLF